jgi:3-hydroxyisobutyrate dehydrogenase
MSTQGSFTIGWIGTGIMGSSMAGHLLAAGHRLRVYNRTPEKARTLLDAGAAWTDSPAQCAQGCQFVFTIVGFPQDVRQVHLAHRGVLEGVAANAVVVDMTTTAPSLARELAAAYAAKGVSALDAPVSGGDVGAREARLAIMVGGEKAAYDRAMPLFEKMGRNIAFMGPAGAGQHTKMCNQILIAGTLIGTCESLLYAVAAGLDQSAVIGIIGQGAAGGWTINNLGPRIVRRDFEPGFMVEHFIKDMGIALGESKAMGLSLPGLALVEQLYLALQANGGGRKGTQGLMLVLEQLAGRRTGTA